MFWQTLQSISSCLGIRSMCFLKIWRVRLKAVILCRNLTLGNRPLQGLVLRCLPVLSSQQYYQIASTLLKNLVVVLHKDKADNMLHKFYVCLQMVS